MTDNQNTDLPSPIDFIMLYLKELFPLFIAVQEIQAIA
jgi:hypothetical protein